MAIRFRWSGGQFHKNSATAGGIWGTFTGSILSSAPAGRASTYAANGGGSNQVETTPAFPSTYGTLIAGAAFYFPSYQAGMNLLGFRLAAANQCDCRMDGVGHLYFTRNGTNLGAGNPTTSTNVLTLNSWHYVEFKAIFATGATGTCEVYVDGALWLTLGSIQNATTTATGDNAQFGVHGSGYTRDCYALDTAGGLNTTYLGDVSVVELYASGPGTNSQWATGEGTTVTQLAANGQAAFTLTSVNTTGVYQGTITGGGSNAYVGYKFTVTGFVNGANNQTSAVCTASTATSLTLGGVTITETHAGTATFDAAVQIGIAATGTIPNGDSLYIYDSTTNDKSDFAHQAASLSGTIAEVAHVTYARKDDAGTRQIAQITVESAAVSETGATISLSSSYNYYIDSLETDPNTGVAWTVTNLNNATFGVKEVT